MLYVTRVGHLINYLKSEFWQWKHCGSGDIFLVGEEQDSMYSCLNMQLLFVSKGLKARDILISLILITCA